MKPDLFWIPGPWRGRLAVSARPRGGDWLEDEARAWRQAGVDLVVSLLEDDEASGLGLMGESRAVEESGMAFLSFPIADRGVPDSTSAAAALIAGVVSALEEGRNVAVHCRQGIGRSGLIAAGVLMTTGAAPDQAMQAVSSSRGVTVPETADQRAWAHQLRPLLAPVAGR